MRLNEYQSAAMRTAKSDFEYVTRGTEADRLTLAALGIGGESGEFVDLIKKFVYHAKPLDRDKAAKELGDLLWYIALAADALGTDLEIVAQMNIQKLLVRYPEGFSPQASAERADLKA